MSSPFNLMLRYKIEQAKMYRLAEIYGLDHPITIKQSQKVDHLVVELQKVKLAVCSTEEGRQWLRRNGFTRLDLTRLTGW